MTLLGKFLVFLTVALSFLMLGWSAALFTNRIDWTGKTAAKAEATPGSLVDLQTRIKAGGDGLDLARNRWSGALKGFNIQDRTARAGLREWERRRAADFVWYDEQLKEARSGPGGNINQPIKRVALQDGLEVPDAQNSGRPTMVAAVRRKAKGEPRQAGDAVFCYDYYIKKMGQLSNDILDVQKKYQAAIEEDIKLTDQIIGPKGLRQQILDEENKIAHIDDELKDVETRKTNGRVETELLLSRRTQLDRRIKELKRTLDENKK